MTINANGPAQMTSMTALAGQHADASVAKRLLESNFNVNSLRTQNTLRKDEWVEFDTAVVETAEMQLTGIQDLITRGLTYNLNNALGRTSLEWENVSSMEGAETTMAGVTQVQNDRVDYELQSMPIPIVHKDFQINIRALEASRNLGESLDTTQLRLATRKVSEALESTLFLGSTVLGSNKPLYGYSTAPNRNTGSVTATWVSATGNQMLTDTLRMIEAAQGDHMYGPYIMYVSRQVYTNMGNDFKAESDLTVEARLRQVPGIADIRPSEFLTGTNVILVQMSPEVVQLIDGFGPTMVEWSTQGGFVQHYKVMAIMPPRIRSDYDDQSGIVHFS